MKKKRFTEEQIAYPLERKSEASRMQSLSRPLLLDGLSGLVHGALLASILANLGVHEIEAGSLGMLTPREFAELGQRNAGR